MVRRAATAAESPDETPQAEPDAPETAAEGGDFRALADALADVEEQPDEPSLCFDALLTDAVRAANREGRHAAAAVLHELAVRQGDFLRALRAAESALDGPLADEAAIFLAMLSPPAQDAL